MSSKLFKVGDVVVCIDNTEMECSLTLNREYIVSQVYFRAVVLKYNDRSDRDLIYNSCRFKHKPRIVNMFPEELFYVE